MKENKMFTCSQKCYTLLPTKIIFYDWSLCDVSTALNGALKQEVERLKVATGEISVPSGSYRAGLQHMPYNSPFFSLSQDQGFQMQMGQSLSQAHANLSNQPILNHSRDSHSVSDTTHHDPLGRSLQGLDIRKGSLAVKSENSSISASESSSTM